MIHWKRYHILIIQVLLPMTMRREARWVVRVKKVHRAITVEVRSPIVRVDQHRSRGDSGYIRHGPYHLVNMGESEWKR